MSTSVENQLTFRCGKLTYHVIVPWSILFFPYVKAAILSTYEEDPCNGCDVSAFLYVRLFLAQRVSDTEVLYLTRSIIVSE